MWARTTRLELLIVTIGLLVLLFCSKPPQSGSAQMYDPSPTEQDPSRSSEELAPAFDLNNPPRPMPGHEEVMGDHILDREGDDSNHQQTNRVGVVDARNLSHLPYSDVMYGDVTVRWVWNGTRFMPQKVCVVEEKDGVSSVWSFEQQDKAIVSEISEDPGTTP